MLTEIIRELTKSDEKTIIPSGHVLIWEKRVEVLCKAIAFLVSFYYKSRGLYALNNYFTYSPHFAHLQVH